MDAPEPQDDFGLKESIEPTNDLRSEAALIQRDLHGLLTMCESAELKDGITAQITKISKWIDDYCSGLDAAVKLSNIALPRLDIVKNRVDESLGELHRLEDEGGAITQMPKQKEVFNELGHALRRIHRLKPAIENHFKITDDLIVENEIHNNNKGE
jgi:hypothetical protein